MPRLATPVSRPVDVRSPRTLILATVMVIALLGLIPLTRVLATPATVGVLHIENPHAWTVNVDVADGRDGTRLGLGAVARGRTATFETVLDQGSSWVVIYEYAGIAVPVELSRTELASADWHLTVPDAIATQLASAGVAQTPLLDSGGSPRGPST